MLGQGRRRLRGSRRGGTRVASLLACAATGLSICIAAMWIASVFYYVWWVRPSVMLQVRGGGFSIIHSPGARWEVPSFWDQPDSWFEGPTTGLQVYRASGLGWFGAWELHRDLFEPRKVYGVGLPFWPLFLVSLVISCLLWKRVCRRLPLGLCTHCGYDLTGNVSGRCPECGGSVDPASPVSRAGESRNDPSREGRPRRANPDPRYSVF